MQQLLLGHLAAVDVGQRARHPVRLAAGAAHGDAAAQHPAVAAVAVPHPVLVLEVPAAAREVVADLLLEARQLVRVDAAEPLLGEDRELVLVVPEHLLPARRVVDLVALQVPVPEPVVGAVDRQRVALLRDPQGLLVVLALDGIADRAVEQRRVDLALDQVVLRSLAHRPQRQPGVVVPGHDHDRHLTAALVEPLEGLDAARIGQRQVEQHDVEGPGREQLEPFLEPVAGGQLIGGGGRLGEVDLHQPGVARAVLDQQHPDRLVAHQPCLPVRSRLQAALGSGRAAPRSGRVKKKVEPSPGRDSAQMRPP